MMVPADARTLPPGVKRFGLKREVGANPTRSRHCEIDTFPDLPVFAAPLSCSKTGASFDLAEPGAPFLPDLGVEDEDSASLDARPKAGPARPGQIEVAIEVAMPHNDGLRRAWINAAHMRRHLDRGRIYEMIGMKRGREERYP